MQNKIVKKSSNKLSPSKILDLQERFYPSLFITPARTSQAVSEQLRPNIAKKKNDALARWTNNTKPKACRRLFDDGLDTKMANLSLNEESTIIQQQPLPTNLTDMITHLLSERGFNDSVKPTFNEWRQIQDEAYKLVYPDQEQSEAHQTRPACN